MKKEDFEALGFTPEQAEKAAAASTEELKGFIPKHRFDEVNDAKKAAEDQVKERDKQLDTLKTSVKDNEELTTQIKTLQEDNKAAKEKHDAELQRIKIKGAAEREVLEAEPLNPVAAKAILGLLKDDLEKAELDGDNVKGLADRIKGLKEAEESKVFFKAQSSGNAGQGGTSFKGAKPAEGSNTQTDKTQTSGNSLRDGLTAHFSGQQQ